MRVQPQLLASFGMYPPVMELIDKPNATRRAGTHWDRATKAID